MLKMQDSTMKEQVQTLCVYYARLHSEDPKRRKITNKYKDLELLTGINSNTIKQWTDTLDPKFDNGRKGYHQITLEKHNKDLKRLYDEYGTISMEKLEKRVFEIERSLRGNTDNQLTIADKVVNLYSIKTKDDDTAEAIISGNKVVEINNLNWYRGKIREGDLIFIALGGDRKPWNNGLVGLAKVSRGPYEAGSYTNNFKIEIEMLIKFPVELTPKDFYYYPNIRDVINIGPALKGVPNQAINRVPYVGAMSIFRAIIDIFPEKKEVITDIVGLKNMRNITNYIPKLDGKGERDRKDVFESLENDFEGSVDLEDTLGWDSEKAEWLDEIDMGNEEIIETIKKREEEKKDLMKSSLARQKTQISISRDFHSVYELFRKYQRFTEYASENEAFDLKNIESSMVLSPDFQRDDVWTKKKKVQLIESILLGIPLPAFYFSEDVNGNFLVVDGKQRLNAIFSFIMGKVELDSRLRFLAVDADSKKSVRFDELQPKIQRKVEDFPLMCHVIGIATPPFLRNEIFVRVNRGGVPLNQQEIRNAVNVGKVTLRLLNRITEDDGLYIVPTKRRKDQYIALRFFALYLATKDDEFKEAYDFKHRYDNMDNFLDFVMKYINTLEIEEIDGLFELYERAFTSAQFVFKDGSLGSFTRSNSNVVNMNIFETWMLVMSDFSGSKVKNNVKIFVQCYEELVNDEDFLDNILYLRDNKDKVWKRMEYAEQIRRKIEDEIV